MLSRRVEVRVLIIEEDVRAERPEHFGLLDPAKERIKGRPGDPATALEYESIRVTLENLMTFPFVASRVQSGKLKLAGARYGVADGGLEIFDPEKDVFSPVE